MVTVSIWQMAFYPFSFCDILRFSCYPKLELYSDAVG